MIIENSQRQFPGNSMTKGGDMVLWTGYPVMVVVVVVMAITTIEADATIALSEWEDNMFPSCCISKSKEIDLKRIAKKSGQIFFKF